VVGTMDKHHLRVVNHEPDYLHFRSPPVHHIRHRWSNMHRFYLNRLDDCIELYVLRMMRSCLARSKTTRRSNTSESPRAESAGANRCTFKIHPMGFGAILIITTLFGYTSVYFNLLLTCFHCYLVKKACCK